MQVPPTTLRFFHLLVAVVVFVVTVVQVLLVDEVLVNPVVVNDSYFIHLCLLVFIYLVFNSLAIPLSF